MFFVGGVEELAPVLSSEGPLTSRVGSSCGPRRWRACGPRVARRHATSATLRVQRLAIEVIDKPQRDIGGDPVGCAHPA